MGLLTGKKALITGAGQGIGLAIAKELANAGCDLAIHYYTSRQSAEGLIKKLQEQSVRCVALQADLTEENEVTHMVQEAATFLGGLDILVNNTGDLFGRRKIEDMDLAFWNKVADINMTSMMLVTRQAIPYLEKTDSSSIVNLSSLAGRKGGHSGSICYATFKGAILTWTRALSTELGSKGIRVNSVAPGLILGTHFHETHTTEDSANQTIQGIPLKRAGCPEDVARAVRFLASEYNGFITGITLDVNGGSHVY